MSVVVFDLDDTLFPERAYAVSGLRHVGGHLRAAFGVEDAAERLLAALHAGVRGRIFDVVLAQVGLPPAIVPDLVRRYREHRPDIALHPDAAELLDTLEGSFPLGLITDGPAVCQRRKIEALGLVRRFEVILVTDEAGRGCWKPDPWAYRQVEERLGVSGSECVYIGDNAQKDFVRARERGWWTIRVDRGDRLNPGPPPDEAHEAHLVVGTLRGLDPLRPG